MYILYMYKEALRYMLAHCLHFLDDGRCEHAYALFFVATTVREVSDQPTPSPDDRSPAGELASLQCFSCILKQMYVWCHHVYINASTH